MNEKLKFVIDSLQKLEDVKFSKMDKLKQAAMHKIMNKLQNEVKTLYELTDKKFKVGF